MKPLCKVLDEGTAACRARLVERDIADTAVLHKEALHILPANIQYKADIGAKLLRCAQMCESLNLAAVRMQRGLNDCLAVPRRHSTCDMAPLGHFTIKSAKRLNDRGQRRPLVAAIRCIEQFLVTSNGNKLRRRRACIDPNADRAAIVRKISAFDPVTVMALLERLIVRRILEQSEVSCARFRRCLLLRTRDARLHLPHIGCSGIIRERRADRDEIIAVIHINDMIIVEL